ncbi:MAG: transglutaminase domain-containing protein, partial [bacterium]
SYRWQVTKVPALKMDEAWAPPLDDLLDSARVSTLTDWSTVTDWYGKLTLGKAALTPEIQRVADEKTKGCATVAEKIAALHKAVRELAYVGIEMGGQSDEPHPALQVMLRNYGDCKDKSTLLRALLAAEGIESWYVLVRTTDKGVLDRELYGPGEFNHVILLAKTPEGDRYLDVTDADCPAELLPPLVAGADALIIRGTGELVTLPVPSPEMNHTDIAITATVAPEGTLKGLAKLNYGGHTAVIQRGMLAGVARENYTTVLGGMLAPRLGQDVQVTGVTVQNLDNPSLPLLLEAQFTSVAPTVAGTMRLLYLPTFMYQPNPLHNARARTLKLQRRMAGSMHMTADIILPEGWKPLNPPAPVQETSAIGSYRDEVKTDGNILHFICNMTSNRGTFPITQYPDFQRWAGIMALEGRNPLVVVLTK